MKQLRIILALSVLLNMSTMHILCAQDVAVSGQARVENQQAVVGPVSGADLLIIDKLDIKNKTVEINAMMKQHEQVVYAFLAVTIGGMSFAAFQMARGLYTGAYNWLYDVKPVMPICPQCNGTAVPGTPPVETWGAWFLNGTKYTALGLAGLASQTVASTYIQKFVKKVLHSSTLTWYMRDQVRVRSYIAQLKKDAAILEAEGSWHCQRGHLFMVIMKQLVVDATKVCAFMKYKKALLPKEKRVHADTLASQLMKETNQLIVQVQQSIDVTGLTVGLSAAVKAYEQQVRECVKAFEDLDDEKEDLDKENDLQIQLHQARARIKTLEQSQLVFAQLQKSAA
jgi:hypothetical protein